VTDRERKAPGAANPHIKSIQRVVELHEGPCQKDAPSEISAKEGMVRTGIERNNNRIVEIDHLKRNAD
jgi:hypothetical protein